MRHKRKGVEKKNLKQCECCEKLFRIKLWETQYIQKKSLKNISTKIPFLESAWDAISYFTQMETNRGDDTVVNAVSTLSFQ